MSVPRGAHLIMFEREHGRKADERWHYLADMDGMTASALCGKRTEWARMATVQDRREALAADGLPTLMCRECARRGGRFQ